MSLIAYTRLNQEGIEEILGSNPPTRDEKTGHCFFDDFRIALKYKYNEEEKLSGVGVVTFAPNGLVWFQNRVYCQYLDRYASYYNAIEQTLEEAKKSHAKRIIVLVDDEDFVKYVKVEKPWKSEVGNKIHEQVICLLKEFESFEFVFRKDYPRSVQDRLDKESDEASQPFEFDWRSHWSNSSGMMYFNVIPQTEEEMKSWAEQYANVYLDFMKDYTKEYEQDFGRDALKELIRKAKDKEITELPSTKRVLVEQRRTESVKNKLKLKKTVVCQNCDEIMKHEKSYRQFPENELEYIYRCYKCLATRTINHKGRTIKYGRYPKKPTE